MRLIIVTCLLGFAAASLLKEAAPAVDDMLDAHQQDRIEKSIVEEVVKKLKDSINTFLIKLLEDAEKKKEVSMELIGKIKEVIEKLKRLHLDVTSKIKEIIINAKGVAEERIKEILEKLFGKKDARAVDEMSENYHVDRIERSVYEEITKMLKKDLERLMTKLVDLVENGQEMKPLLMNSIRSVINLLKNRNVDMTDKVCEILKDAEGIADETIEEIMDELYGNGEKRSLHDVMDYVSELKFKDLIEDIKQKVLSNEVVQKIREHIKNFVATNPVIQKMKEAILKLSDLDLRQFIKDLLHLDTSRDRRSVRDLYEKIKDYLESFSIELKEKWIKFGEWVKEIMGKGLDKMKEKKENIKFIAKELHKHVKDVSQEVLREGIDFLRPYKEDLGELWNQLKDSVKEVLGKDD